MNSIIMERQANSWKKITKKTHDSRDSPTFIQATGVKHSKIKNDLFDSSIALRNRFDHT